MSSTADSNDVVVLAVIAWIFVLAVIAWIFGGAALGTAAETCRRWSQRRHKRRVELAEASAPKIIHAAGGQPGTLTAASDRAYRAAGLAGAGTLTAEPGPCQHRNSVPVQTLDGEVVGWLCRNPGCGKRLPAGWAVLAEDREDR